MEITDAVRKIFQDMIVPELGKIREENQKIVAILELTNKRLDDVNTHLADQSRRIDVTNKRIDGTNKRFDDVNKRFDDVNKRIDDVRSELTIRIEDIHSDLVNRLDANNERIDRFFLTAATKEELARNDARLFRVEQGLEEVRQRLAA
jgi:chromosome segregation ATPase